MNTFKQFIKEARTPKERIPGKDTPEAFYVHKDYVLNHPKINQDDYKKALSQLPTDFNFTIVKRSKKDGSFSFIQSPDWDTSHEPTTGDAIKIGIDGKQTLTKQKKDPNIYHHPWQFVGDDYNNFRYDDQKEGESGLDRSKRRSKEWQAVPNVNKSKIGYKGYWDREVVPQIVSI